MLTGRSSPRPAIIAAVTVRTNSGAPAGTTGGSSRVDVTRPGTSIWCRPSTARSTPAWFRSTTSAPRRDSLFPGGVGRTNSPEDFNSLLNDVSERLFDPLPDATWVYPGHGNDTTLGEERPHLGEWRERGW